VRLNLKINEIRRFNRFDKKFVDDDGANDSGIDFIDIVGGGDNVVAKMERQGKEIIGARQFNGGGAGG
jgi:hypothetical protein